MKSDPLPPRPSQNGSLVHGDSGNVNEDVFRKARLPISERDCLRVGAVEEEEEDMVPPGGEQDN